MIIRAFSTKRLYFLPVQLSDLQWNVNTSSDRKVKQEYLNIMENGFSDDGNELWYTIWEIRRKSDDKLVGVFRFFGPPNENFETEIDFGIKDEYEGRGYGSEAFRCIIDFLFSFRRCSYIKCSVSRGDNDTASFVKSFGFKKNKESADTETYELEKKRRHTALPLMLTGIAVTVAMKFYFGTLEPVMWLVAPAMFGAGLVFDFLDASRRKKAENI